MTKEELITKITKDIGMKKLQIKKVVNALFKVMIETLVKGEHIEVRNFGVFKVKKKKAKLGRNFKTQTTIRIPERFSISFKPAKLLKKNMMNITNVKEKKRRSVK
jgi:nucleoid DNA-binding protein